MKPGRVTSGAKSEALFDRANGVIPGGVNTARRKIDPPLCVARARGAYIEDVDGNTYVDYHAAYGAIFLGHSWPSVTEAVTQAAETAVLPGVGVTELEVRLAEKLTEHVPSAERVVFCGSGSEATYHAVRLARAATNRRYILKFQGLYHGFHDYVLRNVMSEPGKIGRRDPHSAGMLPEAVDSTLVCRFNDLEDVRSAFATHGEDIAAVIVEPIAHNSPSILPAEGFLEGLRAVCDQHGAVLIFDEVITGIRHHLGGFQSIADVTPDVTCLAKALGNGFPIAAVAGAARLLDRFNTTAIGDVTFAGTYNGGGVPVAAALATIETIEQEPVHRHVFALGDRMREGLRELAAEKGVAAIVSGYGSLYVMLFMDGELRSYDDVQRNDHELFVGYRRELVRRGVFEMPENIGRNHISYSHTEADIDFSLEVAREALGAALDRHSTPAAL